MSLIQEKISEARRAQEDCLYTSTMLYFHAGGHARLRKWLLVISSVSSILATSVLFKEFHHPLFVAICSLISALANGVYLSWRPQEKAKVAKKYAEVFKSLEKEFRRIANEGKYLREKQFNKKFDLLWKRFQKAREESPLVASEADFKKAQQKIADGDYAHQEKGNQNG